MSFSISLMRDVQRLILSFSLRNSCCSNFFSLPTSLSFIRNFFSITADFFFLALIGAFNFSNFFSIRSTSVYIGIALLCCFLRSLSAFSKSDLVFFSSLLYSVVKWLISCMFVSKALFATAMSFKNVCLLRICLSISTAIASGSLKALIILSS